MVSGFEPLDMLQSIVMMLRQLKAGEAKVENQYKRVVPWEGNRAALQRHGRSLRAAPLLRVARPGIHFAIGACASATVMPNGMPSSASGSRHARHRSQGRAVRRSAEGRAEAAPVQAVRQGVHAGASDGRADGFIRRLMRSLLQLRTPQGGNGDQHERHWREADTDVEARPRSKIRFRDPQIEMAHGAGGKASRRLVEGLFAPLLFGLLREPLGDAAHLDMNGAHVAITTDSFVVKPLTFPGGSIGELAVNGTVNDLAVSGARAEALVVTFVLEAGLPTRVLEAEVRAMAQRRAASRASRSSAAIPRSSSTARPTACTSPPPASAADSRREDRSEVGPPGRQGSSLRPDRRSRHHDSAGARRTRYRSRSSLRHALGAAAGRGAGEAAGPGIRWMRDPTRGGVATSLNELARDCGLGIVLQEEQIPVRDAVRGACELLGLDPLHIANEGQFLAVVAPEYADAALNALSAAPGGEEAQMIGEVREQPARIGVGDDALRRQPHRRHAGRRSVAAHLLAEMQRWRTAGCKLATARSKSGCSSANELCRSSSSRAKLRGWPKPAERCRALSARRPAAGLRTRPYATDAQHVSVEFVHPVIVGKRALPALDLSILFRPWLRSHSSCPKTS